MTTRSYRRAADSRKPRARGRARRQAHPAHHRRRHRGLQIARPDPPAARARHRRARGDDGRRAEVHHAAVGRRARRRASVHSTCSITQSEFDVGHIRLAREPSLIVVAPATADLMAKMAQRPRRRSRLRGAARDRQDDLARAGDEPEHVEQPGYAAKHRAARSRRRRARRAERRRDGRERRSRRRPHGGAAGDRRGCSRRCSRRSSRRARRCSHAGDVGADARADRSGALHRQPLVRQAGPCHRRSCGCGRRRR